MINVLVVEDHPLLREIIVARLNSQADIIVTGQADNGHDAIALFNGGITADIILTDLQMPIMNGIELTRYIVNSNLTNKAVIILSMKDHELYKGQAINAGAKAVLSKMEDFELILKSIRDVFKQNVISSHENM